MVGDTLADMGMGKSARLGATIGVLSGIGDRHELDKHADHLVRILLFSQKRFFAFLDQKLNFSGIFFLLWFRKIGSSILFDEILLQNSITKAVKSLNTYEIVK